MGAGDLNVKKSWHPRLQKNQEKVWMQEQEAEAERKKLDELRKEREQERQMQELQRIHEAAGGKKRPERVEWMYATPASSSGSSEAELEEYLLGKKRVDKLLQGNEAAQLSRVSDPGSQRDDSTGANSARDMALKIREDPLFAIKKQEQAMQEMLLRDPSRLRQMRARLGLPNETPRHRHEHENNRSRHRDRHHRQRGDRSHDDRRYRYDHSHRYHDTPSRRRSRSPEPRRLDAKERDARLASMMKNAKSMETDRNAMIERVTEHDRHKQAEEERQREKTHDKSRGGRAKFFHDQQRQLWGDAGRNMNLEESLRRGRHALQSVGDDHVS